MSIGNRKDCHSCNVPLDVFDNMVRLLRRADPARCMVSEGAVATLQRIIDENALLRGYAKNILGARGLQVVKSLRLAGAL